MHKTITSPALLPFSRVIIFLVSFTSQKEFAELNSMCWLETSAKDCTNVKEAFETMAYKLCESHEQYLSFSSENSIGPSSFTLHGAYGVPEQTEGYCSGCTSTS